MPYTAAEINTLRENLGSHDEKTLIERFDALMAKQNDTTFLLDKKTRTTLKAFFGSTGIWSIDFRLAKGLASVNGVLNDAKSELTVLHLRIIQETILKHTTITSLEAAGIVDNVLVALNPINVEMSRFEEEAKHVAEFLNRIEQVKETGLEHKKDDTAEDLPAPTEKADTPLTKV